MFFRITLCGLDMIISHMIIYHTTSFLMTSTEYGWFVVNILLIMANINGYNDGFHDG